MILGSKSYIFVPDGTANGEGEISIGSDLATAKVNIVTAINGSDGHNTPNTSVLAADFIGTDCIISALIGGVSGDSIVAEGTFNDILSEFDSETLGTTTAGADCTASNTIIKLAAEVLVSGNGNYTLVDGVNDTMDCASVIKGVIGNDIVISETLSHGSWTGAAVLLSGGIDGTVGINGATKKDTSFFYWTVAENTIHDSNWVRTGGNTF
jgi:hypothetical protein